MFDTISHNYGCDLCLLEPVAEVRKSYWWIKTLHDLVTQALCCPPPPTPQPALTQSRHEGSIAGAMQLSLALWQGSARGHGIRARGLTPASEDLRASTKMSLCVKSHPRPFPQNKEQKLCRAPHTKLSPLCLKGAWAQGSSPHVALLPAYVKCCLFAFIESFLRHSWGICSLHCRHLTC